MPSYWGILHILHYGLGELHNGRYSEQTEYTYIRLITLLGIEIGNIDVWALSLNDQTAKVIWSRYHEEISMMSYLNGHNHIWIMWYDPANWLSHAAVITMQHVRMKTSINDNNVIAPKIFFTAEKAGFDNNSVGSNEQNHVTLKDQIVWITENLTNRTNVKAASCFIHEVRIITKTKWKRPSHWFAG